jgi:hypothetical protein
VLDSRPHAAGEPHSAGGCERAESFRLVRVDQARDCFVAGGTGRDEDGGHDEQTGDALGARGAQQEGDAERDRSRGVAGDVDEVCEQATEPLSR